MLLTGRQGAVTCTSTCGRRCCAIASPIPSIHDSAAVPASYHGPLGRVRKFVYLIHMREIMTAGSLLLLALLSIADAFAFQDRSCKTQNPEPLNLNSKPIVVPRIQVLPRHTCRTCSSATGLWEGDERALDLFFVFLHDFKSSSLEMSHTTDSEPHASPGLPECERRNPATGPHEAAPASSECASRNP